MQRQNLLIFALIFILGIVSGAKGIHYAQQKQNNVLSTQDIKPSYWLLLHRKSNVEFLYFGTPGEKGKSELIKTFTVKTGVPGEKPTPLPKLLNRGYWLIVKKEPSENPEIAPYFLTLDIPVSDEEPYGPMPYTECNGQCNWVLPGSFGLHGVNGDQTRLAKENEGSSGCIRHTDADITLLYHLLELEKEEIRYYIEDI